MQTKFLTCCMLAVIGTMACNSKPEKENETKTSSTNPLALINDVSKDLFKHIDVAPQSFVVSATKSAKVTTASGFELDIEPNKLALQSTEPITITIKECLDTDALLAANAATICNGNILVSSGSYYIEASQNGKKVDIKNGEKLAIRAPKKNDSKMELFYGDRDEAGNMNWNVAESKIVDTEIATLKNVKVPMQVSEKVISGDTVISKPSSLATCLKIHYDSTMKARWDYTRANRNKFTYAQEIRYGLQPIKFPFDRFEKKIVGEDKAVKKRILKFGSFEFDTGYSNALSYMYVTKDTVPLYKDSVYTKMVDNMDEVYTTYEESYIGNFGWINIDRFLKETLCDSTTITLNTKLEDLKIYYKFLDMNSVVTETMPDNTQTILPLQTKLPLGKKVELIVVGSSGNTIYTSKKIFTITKKNKVEIKLLPLSQGKQV